MYKSEIRSVMVKVCIAVIHLKQIHLKKISTKQVFQKRKEPH